MNPNENIYGNYYNYWEKRRLEYIGQTLIHVGSAY